MELIQASMLNNYELISTTYVAACPRCTTAAPTSFKCTPNEGSGGTVSEIMLTLPGHAS